MFGKSLWCAGIISLAITPALHAESKGDSYQALYSADAIIYNMETFLNQVSPQYIREQCERQKVHGLHSENCSKIYFELMFAFAESLAEWQEIYSRIKPD